MEEIWKTIEGFEDYQISNFGRVKSLKLKKEKILKHGFDRYGYAIFNLCKDGKCKTTYIHQLVAISFLNHIKCGYKLVINHKDLNKLNNHIDNLEIVTARYNNSHKGKKHSSIYTGVCWDKYANKWKSGIRINGKSKHIGYFNNEYDAHIAYQNKLKELI